MTLDELSHSFKCPLNSAHDHDLITFLFWNDISIRESRILALTEHCTVILISNILLFTNSWWDSDSAESFFHCFQGFLLGLCHSKEVLILNKLATGFLELHTDEMEKNVKELDQELVFRAWSLSRVRMRIILDPLGLMSWSRVLRMSHPTWDTPHFRQNQTRN